MSGLGEGEREALWDAIEGAFLDTTTWGREAEDRIDSTVERIIAARTTDLATAWQDGYNAAKVHLRWEDEPVNPWVGKA